MLGNKEPKMARNSSVIFKLACEIGNIKMTKRQEKKFNKGVGQAHKFYNDAYMRLTSMETKDATPNS